MRNGIVIDFGFQRRRRTWSYGSSFDPSLQW
jgi:hypothetical protein